MEDSRQQDICRVCRSEGSSDKPLFHPCVCTGSIRYIHQKSNINQPVMVKNLDATHLGFSPFQTGLYQECLMQWLGYSKKEYCELCKHKFSFKPIYSPDMPKRLPIYDIFSGLVKSVARAFRYWFQSTLVALAWLGIVPLTACRIYRCLFTGSVSSLLTLPLDMLSTENIVSDCFQGCFVVTCTLCAFIGLVWLREQILHGGGPEWLEPEPRAVAAANANNQQPAAVVAVQNQPLEAAEGLQQQQPVDNDNGGNEANDGAPVEGALQVVNDDNNAQQPDAANEDLDADNIDDDNDIEIAQENVFNPIEWDRAAEELTWERLLGLDGSLVFLEHVFWVVSLNTLFILVFAFCPYHIGHFTITGLHIEEYFSVTQFEGLLTTILGYLIISVSLVLLHTFAATVSFAKFKRALGLCYVVVKVSLLVVVEIGIFPLVCGWWLDICSLSMFDATLKDRANSFKLAPGTSMFIHWLVGMVYVFYFASFILLLREVLRPGVLWFLRNLNDPDFNPIHEMIHLPVYRHVRRFLASMVIFGSTVLLMLWLPVKLIRFALPTFLPYNVMLSSDAPVSELSLELLLLQVVLPALLEQGYTRQWLKGVVHSWCVAMAWLLDVRSYLLGDTPLEETIEQVVEPRDNILVPNEQQHQELPQQVENPEEAQLQQEPPPPAAERVENPQEAQLQQDPPPPAAERVENPQEAQLQQDPPPPAAEWVENPQEAQPQKDQLPQAADRVENPQEVQEAVAAANPPDQVVNARLEEVAEEVVEEIQQPAAEVPQINIIPAAPVQPPAPLIGQGGGLGAAHQAMLLGGGRTGFQPYKQPTYYGGKVVILVVSMCATLFMASVIAFIAPVFIGRRLMALWMGDTRIHELYTAACGLYSCWIFLRAVSILSHWIPQGWKAILCKVRDWLVLGAKSVIVASLLIGVIPLLLGLLFELVVVVPLRVPLNQSPIFFPWQDWALGILHAKIMCAITMMLPHWWLRRTIEQVYNQGWRNMNLYFILSSLCFPVIGFLSMCIALPYAFTRGFVPLCGVDFEKENLILRRIYPCILCVVLFATYLVFQIKQFKKLYEHIKNDKYLVGQRLVNYEKRSNRDQVPVR